jgi:hypothetical protein
VPDLPFKTGAQIALSLSRSAVFASPDKAFPMPDLPQTFSCLVLAAKCGRFTIKKPIEDSSPLRFGLHWR